MTQANPVCRLRSLLCLALVVAFCASSALADEDAAAMLYGTQLDVKLRRAKEPAWAPINGFTKLYERDSLKLGAMSSAIVEFNDDTKLSLFARSLAFIVSSKSQDGVSDSELILVSGSLGADVQHDVDHPAELVIRTARGWIKGSSKSSARFSIEATASGNLDIYVERGDVTLLAKGRSKAILAGEHLAATGAALPVKDISTDDFDNLPPAGEEWKVSKEAPKATPQPTAKPKRASGSKTAKAKHAHPVKRAKPSPSPVPATEGK